MTILVTPHLITLTYEAALTMGLFVSMAGYSSVAINEASGKKTTMLILDASHIFLVITGGMSLAEVIRRVRRHASQTGESYLPIATFGG